MMKIPVEPKVRTVEFHACWGLRLCVDVEIRLGLVATRPARSGHIQAEANILWDTLRNLRIA